MPRKSKAFGSTEGKAPAALLSAASNTISPLGLINATLANCALGFYSKHTYITVISLNTNCFHLFIFTQIRNELGVIGFLYVKDDYRRQGVAEDLVIYLCHALAKQGFDATAHIVDGNTPSLKLFTRLGFEAIEYNYWFIKADI